MSSAGAAPRAAVPVSNARAEASRRNGARSRGPKSPEGKARSAQNALKHGMRAAQHVVLPDESAVEFNALQALLFEELAPLGALQLVLARRVAVAAWRLARADRLEAEVLEFRSYEGASAGVALMRDGNGPRSVETLLRYRGAAMAEFMRALKTLKVLQAEEAAATQQQRVAAPAPVRAQRPRPTACSQIAHRPQPKEPERRPESRPERRLEYVLPAPPVPGRILHEEAAPWTPRRSDAERTPNGPAGACLAPNEPEPHGDRGRNAGPTSNEPARSCLAPNEPPARVSRRANPNLTGTEDATQGPRRTNPPARASRQTNEVRVSASRSRRGGSVGLDASWR